jgi:hypothetical protein
MENLTVLNMKRYIIAAALWMAALSLNAQKMNNSDDLQTRIQLIEDKMALKEVVDVFSILADQKDVEKQLLLFTENATVTSVFNGQGGQPLVGRKQIGEAFSNFLKNFDVVYHVNGQQTVTINGDQASGVSYCMVTLIGPDNGKKMRTTMWVYYNDDFVRVNKKWLIARRTSNFVHREVGEVAQ